MLNRQIQGVIPKNPRIRCKIVYTRRKEPNTARVVNYDSQSNHKDQILPCVSVLIREKESREVIVDSYEFEASEQP
jgi:hypothetical protein